MKNSLLKFLAILFVSIILFSSCSRKIIDFTIVSTRNISLNKLGTFLRSGERTDGYDVKHIVIFTPLGQLDIKLAVDRAIDAIPGCVALVDCLVYTQGFWAIIYGQTTLIAEGTPIIDPSLLDAESTSIYKQSDYLMVILDKSGNIEKVQDIDKEEYLKYKSRVDKSTKKSFSIQKG